MIWLNTASASLQVGCFPSLHARKTSNRCEFRFPCPQVLFLILNDCISVVDLLLQCGDVELNPGPTSDALVKQLAEMNAVLRELKSQTNSLGSRQESILSTVQTIQTGQQDISDQLADLSSRMTVVEGLKTVVDKVNQELVALKAENLELRARLDDIENQSRRNNLVFHGITDVSAETWAQSETKVTDLITDVLGLPVPAGAFERVHRLGSFRESRTRPIIAKFSSFKFRDIVFQNKSKLKGSKILVHEDFCAATRLARKKLYDYGLAQKVPFRLRLSKLWIDSRCYVYDSQDDSIRCINPVSVIPPGAARSVTPTNARVCESPPSTVDNPTMVLRPRRAVPSSE